MNIIIDILLQSSKITTIVVGIAGLILSLALLFSRDAVRNVSAALNRKFNLGLPARELNRQVSVDTIIGWFPSFSGAMIAAASLAVMIYLFFSPMPPQKGGILLAIIFESMLWLARLASVLGLVFGIMLMVAPEALKRVNRMLNHWHDTEAIIRHMEQRTYNFDGLVLNNPRISGVIGLFMSVILLLLTLSQK